MRFDRNKVLDDSKKDFIDSWINHSRILPKSGKLKRMENGKKHPVIDIIYSFRNTLLKYGFDEVINKTIIPEKEIYRQYGPEANVILDRVFYLAKLPRIELGLGNERINLIRNLIGDFEVEKLEAILRRYKKGEVESDDLIETISEEMNVPSDKVSKIFDSNIFTELIELNPISTDNTLRSHMTGAWFSTLQNYQSRMELPISLFSIGLRYRNEQREDASHLRVHNSASLVIMDENISLEIGKKITSRILKELGFNKVKFKLKHSTSTYYAHEQEMEVFVVHNNEWWEIGDIGMYSPIALCEYGIDCPVFNAGFGIERIAAILNDYSDIRELVYYPYNSMKSISDSEIYKKIKYKKFPTTELGKIIEEKIMKKSIELKDVIGPCTHIIFENDRIIIEIIEKEKKPLLGPAATNIIEVHNGNIIGIENMQKSNNISYLSSISKEFAYEIEMFLLNNTSELILKKKNSKRLSDINLEIPNQIRNYILNNHKKLDIRGPIFITLKVTKK